MQTADKQHWDKVYQTKNENEVSWYQPHPKTSVQFIEELQPNLSASIIDIGGGESHLAEALLDKGYTDITVLDISANAIEKAKKRLGDKAALITWIVTDVLEFTTEKAYDIWHDRATFHFLTTDDKINHYVDLTEKHIASGGHLIIGTFSEYGPTKCSGLPVKQYTTEALTARFAHGFRPLKCIHEDHHTPFNTIQNFTFCSFKKKS